MLDADGPQKLKRSLTLWLAVLYGLGVTIGAGIYVLVGIAAGRSGMHAPLAFVLAALVMLFSAASFAELGTRMPVSASEAAYVEKAFNRPWLSLTMGLLVVVTATISAATISVGRAGYLGVFIDLPARWIITFVVVSMGLVACLSTRQSVTLAGIMTLVELGGLVLIIIAGVGAGSGVLTRLPEIWPASGEIGAWVGLSGTTLIAVFAFIGFEHLVNVAEEMKNPSHTLPWALFLTLGLTALVYALVVWVAVVAVPPDELVRSSAPLTLVFERLTGRDIFFHQPSPATSSNRRKSVSAAGHLDGPDLQRVGIDPKVHLAPLPRLRWPVFLGEPLAFALRLDPGAVNQQVQRVRAGPIGYGDVRTFLSARQRAEVRHRQSSPASSSRLATSPVVCRNGNPNSAFNVGHAWIAASVKVAEGARFPLGSASQTVSGSNQISSEPRCFRAAL